MSEYGELRIRRFDRHNWVVERWTEGGYFKAKGRKGADRWVVTGYYNRLEHAVRSLAQRPKSLTEGKERREERMTDPNEVVDHAPAEGGEAAIPITRAQLEAQQAAEREARAAMEANRFDPMQHVVEAGGAPPPAAAGPVGADGSVGTYTPPPPPPQAGPQDVEARVQAALRQAKRHREQAKAAVERGHAPGSSGLPPASVSPEADPGVGSGGEAGTGAQGEAEHPSDRADPYGHSWGTAERGIWFEVDGGGYVGWLGYLDLLDAMPAGVVLEWVGRRFQ